MSGEIMHGCDAYYSHYLLLSATPLFNQLFVSLRRNSPSGVKRRVTQITNVKFLKCILSSY